MEMRSHLAFLLPHGLESKEFRFGVQSAFASRQKVYAKVHIILLYPNIFLQFIEKIIHLT